MFRKTFAAVVAAALLAVAPARAANLPLLSGPNYSEASQILPALNTLIQNINSGVGGLLNAQTAAVATGTGTGEQTLQTYTLPAAFLNAAGQSVRITCWGTTDATAAQNKTRKLYFGASVISTAAEAAVSQNWFLQLTVMYTGAATQSVWGQGLAGTGGVTPISYINQGTDNNAAAVVIKCTGTDAVSGAGQITANGMMVELIK